MKEPQNIRCFNHAVRIILLRLYESFPCPIILKAPEIMSDTEFPEECRVSIRGMNMRSNLVFASMLFLRDEGMIRCTDETAGILANALLTSKGLALLSSTPKSISPEEPSSFIEKLRDNVVEASISGVVKGLVGGMTQWA